VFTARYALSPYIKQIRFVFKGLWWRQSYSLFVLRAEVIPGRHVELYSTLQGRDICRCCCHLERLHMEQSGGGGEFGLHIATTFVFSNGATVPCGPGPPHCQGFTITPHSVGSLWTSDQPVPETSTCTTHNTHNRQTTSMLLTLFEPTIPASKRPQTHAFDQLLLNITQFLFLFECPWVPR
jgi:hypothetical protein